MKIYNKKRFISGITSLGIALLCFATLVMKYDSSDLLGNIKLFLGFILCASFASSSFRHALSRKLSRADFIEDKDERNLLVEYKSGNSAFWFLVNTMPFLMILFAVIWGFTKNEGLIYVFVVLGVQWNIMWIAYLISSIIQENKN